jgi:hypothetical protein
LGLRNLICLALLCVIPVGVYWQSVFHEHGFRDDYAHLREARDVPQNLMRFTATYGRPVYGPLLVASVQQVDNVRELAWLRFAAVVLFTAVAVLVYRELARAGWSSLEAAAVGLGIAFLPSSQVITGWSITWPIALSLLFALLGFRATEAALARAGIERYASWTAGVSFYVLAGLIYQPNVTFPVVPLAGILLLRTDDLKARKRWAAAHIATMIGGLGVALGAMELTFLLGFLPPSPAIEFEPDPIGKVWWFVSEPLANALALFALRDRFDTDAVFWVAVAVVTLLIFLGYRFGARRERAARATWLFCALGLPFVAHGVSLAASSRTEGYRTIFALAGLVVVLVVFSLRALRDAGKLKPATHALALVLLVGVGALLANRHSFTLIAQPQGREWAIIRDAVAYIPWHAHRPTDVYVLRPTIEDRSTRQIFADEFGSLSTNSDWATIEMFKTALRARYPQGLPHGARYTFASGLYVPGPEVYDFVIDMRILRDYRAD